MKRFQVIYVSDWDDARANVENFVYRSKINALGEIHNRLKDIMTVEDIVVDKETDNEGNVTSYFAYFADGEDKCLSLGWEKCELVELN